MEWRRDGEQRWLQAELPGARAAFTTRVGGVSGGPFESLNVGVLNGDDTDDVRENRRRVASALGHSPEKVVIGRQVHGAELAEHDAPQDPSPFADPGPELRISKRCDCNAGTSLYQARIRGASTVPMKPMTRMHLLVEGDQQVAHRAGNP